MKPCNRDPSRSIISSLLVVALSDFGAFKAICFWILGAHVEAFLISSARESSSIHFSLNRFRSLSSLANLVAFMYSSAAWLALSRASSLVSDLSMLASAF